ncbi:hypothetical protein DBR42_00210 [Pelomonas sp. HMWF004]|nr:hypothetical protein DBR42_00210 [Pelomonas sp. HMWF004]
MPKGSRSVGCAACKAGQGTA